MGQARVLVKRFARRRGEVGRVAKRIALIWMPVMTVIFTAMVVFGSSRSFLIEARTDSVTVGFVGTGAVESQMAGPTQWRLPQTTVCRPAAAPRPGATDLCGADFEPQGPVGEQRIQWPGGSTVRLRRADGLIIDVLDAPNVTGADDIAAGSRLIVPAGVLRDMGALTFHGTVTLGEDMASGARYSLHDGRWEAREAGWLISVLRSATEVVKAGTFAAGAKATIIKDDRPAMAFGHLRIAPGQAMAVTLLSEPGDTILSERHFGVAGPVLIKPDWVDVAVSSPLLLAIAAIISALISMAKVMADRPKKD